MVQSIELDCAPFTPRPDNYIESVIADTGLPSREPAAKFFGNWTWDYSDIPAEQWAEAQKITKPRIVELFQQGKIRYGSW